MNLKEYIEDLLIKQKEYDAKILEISTTGSQIFRDNPGDLDYIAICEGYNQRRRKHFFKDNGITYDLIIMDKSVFDSLYDFTEEHYVSPKLKFFNYFYKIRHTIYGGYDDGWNMFDHEIEYKKYIAKKFNETVNIRNSSFPSYGKFYVHYYIILKLFDNQSYDITDEIKTNVQYLYNNDNQYKDNLINWIIGELDKIEI